MDGLSEFREIRVHHTEMIVDPRESRVVDAVGGGDDMLWVGGFGGD